MVARPDLHPHQLLPQPARQVLHERRDVHHHQPEPVRVQPGEQQRDGILIQCAEDAQLYKDAYEEAQRVTSEPEAPAPDADKAPEAEAHTGDKLTSSRIAQKFGLKTAQYLERATEQGFLTANGDRHALTRKGEKAGVEFVAKSRFGPYFPWPQDFHLA